MKKMLLTTYMVATAMGLLAETEKVGDITWRYYISDGIAILGEKRVGSSYPLPTIDRKITGDVEIPSHLGGYPVVGVGEESFCGCAISSVTMPESVTFIMDHAFSSAKISDITFSDNVTNIGMQAFSDCQYLKTVKLPPKLKELSLNLFVNSYITSIDIPASVITIGLAPFYNCQYLKTVTLHEGLTTIGRSAFIGCKVLTSLEIPSTVTSIGNEMCNGCTSLKTVRFKGPVPSLGTYLFWGITPSPSVYYPSKYAREWQASSIGSLFAGYTDANDITTWMDTYPSIATKFGTDMTVILWLESGKQDGTGKNLILYDEYLAGTDPADVRSKFLMTIAVSNSVPQLSWSPALNGLHPNGLPKRDGSRLYRVYGAKTLEEGFSTDPISKEAEAEYNFFKVTVDMPY